MQIIYVPLTAIANKERVVSGADPENSPVSPVRDGLVRAQKVALQHLSNLLNSGDQIVFSDKIVTSEGTFAVFILHPVLQPIGG